MNLGKVLPVFLLALFAQAAHAFEPYVAGLATYVYPDAKRGNADYGLGGQAIFGIPLIDSLDLELNGFGYNMKPQVGNQNDPSYGGGLDLRYNLADSRVFGLYFLIGGGAIHEEVVTDQGVSPYGDAGFSLNFWNFLGLRNLSLRGDARYYYIDRKDGNFKIPALKQQEIGDGRFSLGLEYDFASAAPKKGLEVRDSDNDGVIDTQDQCPNTPPNTQVDDRGCPVVKDSDGDGINDPDDHCPNTPPGTLVDANGCPPPVPEPVALPADSDGDGVVDTLDKCPNTPLGTQVDLNGCPIPIDLDGDGVPNALDRCPNTPPGMKVDATGCVVKQVVVFHNINFEFGSDKLTTSAQTILDGVAAGLRGQPGMAVEISGHTDSLGSQQFNLTLSQKRARSVKAYLMSKGILPTRMSTEGFGEFNPIATNETDEGRAQNRRVEFKVLKQ